ncbi:MAG: hypothetical protein JW885_02800 [Deltaproteobacteria bacterium]|nr:hypothetical protein [Candidatus Zymogenaceae bacterium]
MSLNVKWKHAAVESGGSSCGGAITNNDIRTGVAQNLFPDIDEDTRIDGWELYRKAFCRPEGADPFANGWVYQNRISEGDDYFLTHIGTAQDTQLEASAYSEWAGAGELAASANVGASSFIAEFEAANTIFDASMMFLHNRENGKYERLVLAESGGVAWDDTEATLTAASAVTQYAYPVKTRAGMTGTETETFSLDGTYLTFRVDGAYTFTVSFTSAHTTASLVAAAINGAASGVTGCEITAGDDAGRVVITHDLYYKHHTFQIIAGDAVSELGFDTDIHTGSDGTVVACGVPVGTLEAEVSGVTMTVAASGGSFNNSLYPILGDPNGAGTVGDSWTVTFTSSTEISISGALCGVVYTGPITNNIAPAHWGGVYFIIPKEGWTGSFATGDTLIFDTAGRYAGVWVKNIGPAACGRQSPNRFGLKAVWDY